MKLGRIEYKWIVATVFVLGFFMDILDTTIVNVALPTLGRQFHASSSTIEWVVLGYLLSLAVWIPASGWIGDRFGTKRTFLFALAAFTTASALCGQAHSINELVAFRVLQGVGGGMLSPVGTAMLFRAFPPAERARAASVLMGPTVLAPALGPVVGGWLVTSASWRWIFYVNLPVGIVGFVFGALYLKEHREPTAGRFDVAGFVLSGASLALVLYACSQGPEHGWLSAEVLGTGIGGLFGFATLGLVETRIKQPMLAFRLYRDRMFRNANVVLGLAYGAFGGILFLVPQFLQGLRGLDALHSGLTSFPQAIGVFVASQIVGRIFHQVGPRRLMIAGLIGQATLTAAFLLVGLHTSLWWIRLILFTRGLFMATAMVPMQAVTYANISPADTGRASAIFSTQRQMSQALGVAVLVTVWISRTKALTHGLTAPAEIASARLGAFHDAFFAAVLLVVISAVLVLAYVRDADAASVINRPTQNDRPERSPAGEPAH